VLMYESQDSSTFVFELLKNVFASSTFGQL
jgi:hypothetical protein